MASPKKRYVDIITSMDDFDAPELFRHKVLDAEVPIYHKAQGGELA